MKNKLINCGLTSANDQQNLENIVNSIFNQELTSDQIHEIINQNCPDEHFIDSDFYFVQEVTSQGAKTMRISTRAFQEVEGQPNTIKDLKIQLEAFASNNPDKQTYKTFDMDIEFTIWNQSPSDSFRIHAVENIDEGSVVSVQKITTL